VGFLQARREAGIPLDFLLEVAGRSLPMMDFGASDKSRSAATTAGRGARFADFRTAATRTRPFDRRQRKSAAPAFVDRRDVLCPDLPKVL
jgi:hypothetical protein